MLSTFAAVVLQHTQMALASNENRSKLASSPFSGTFAGSRSVESVSPRAQGRKAVLSCHGLARGLVSEYDFTRGLHRPRFSVVSANSFGAAKFMSSKAQRVYGLCKHTQTFLLPDAQTCRH